MPKIYQTCAQDMPKRQPQNLQEKAKKITLYVRYMAKIWPRFIFKTNPNPRNTQNTNNIFQRTAHDVKST